MFEEWSIFNEPESFRPPSPKPSTVKFKRNKSPQELTLQLPAKHSLWAHELWNGGKSLACYLDLNPHLIKNKRVLELGAGAGLPSLIAAFNGADKIIITDYPEKPLIDNIKRNVQVNAQGLDIEVLGYLWGQPLNVKCDVVLMADIIFNHSQHANILKTLQMVLNKDGIALKTYTHNVVRLKDKDMEFFGLLDDFGFKAEKIYEEKWDPMFLDDPGDLQVRSTVHGWIIRHK